MNPLRARFIVAVFHFALIEMDYYEDAAIHRALETAECTRDELLEAVLKSGRLLDSTVD